MHCHRLTRPSTIAAATPPSPPLTHVHLPRRRTTHQTGKRTFCWRQCEILDVDTTRVYIHYVGWSHRYDEWVDLVAEPDRVRPLGEMTVEETEEERRVKEQEELFRAVMESNALRIHNVDADGNCLFRAVAHQVYGDAERYDAVRQRVCDYMEANRATFAPATDGDFTVYISRMRQDKEWGGHPEQLAIEEVFDRPMEIYSREQFTSSAEGTLEPLKLHFEGGLPAAALKGVAPLRLSYHGGSHFNSVIGPGDAPPLGTRDTTVIRSHRLHIQSRGSLQGLRARGGSFVMEERKTPSAGDEVPGGVLSPSGRVRAGSVGSGSARGSVGGGGGGGGSGLGTPVAGGVLTSGGVAAATAPLAVAVAVPVAGRSVSEYAPVMSPGSPPRGRRSLSSGGYGTTAATPGGAAATPPPSAPSPSTVAAARASSARRRAESVGRAGGGVPVAPVSGTVV